MEIEKKLKFLDLLWKVLWGAEALGLLLFIIGIFATWVLIVVGVILLLGPAFPIYWVWFNRKEISDYFKVFNAVTKKGLTEVEEIATEIKKDLPTTRTLIKDCFIHGLLKDYVRVGEKVVKKDSYDKELHDIKNPDVAIKCPGCGASFQAESGEVATCPYCQTKINA